MALWMRMATIAAAGVAMIGGLYAAQGLLAKSSGELAAAENPAVTAAAMRAQIRGQMAGVTVHEAPQTLPEVSFLDAEGEPIDFSAYRGEVLLVNFWATWCAPCVREMPSIDRLAQKFDGAPFRVVAISLDRGGPAKPAAFLKRIKAERLALHRDPTFKIARDLEVPGLPVTLLLDRQGRERARLLGHAEWDAPEAEALVRALIGG